MQINSNHYINHHIKDIIRRINHFRIYVEILDNFARQAILEAFNVLKDMKAAVVEPNIEVKSFLTFHLFENILRQRCRFKLRLWFQLLPADGGWKADGPLPPRS